MPVMPVFVSYFTPDTPYEAHARRLTQSLSRLGLDSAIEPRAAKGSWVENCAQKASFVREVWRRLDRPICWIDADAMLLRTPHELADLACDFGIARRDGWNFYGGQIYFGRTKTAGHLIDAWHDYCRAYPAIWDQVTLGYAWWDIAVETGVDALWLDDAIFLKASRNVLKRVISKSVSPAAFFHLQESRRARVSRPRKDYRSSDIPGWWRDACERDAPFPLSESQKAELGLADGYSCAAIEDA